MSETGFERLAGKPIALKSIRHVFCFRWHGNDWTQMMNVQAAGPFWQAMSNQKVGSSIRYATDLTADDKSLMTAAYGAGWDKSGPGPNATMKVNNMAFGIVLARQDGALQGPVTASFLTQWFGSFENMKPNLRNALNYLASTDGSQQSRQGHPVSFAV